MRKRQFHTKFRPLSVALQKPTQSICGRRGFHDQNLIRNWKEFVGEELSTLCKPRQIKSARGGKATLILDCLSAHASEVSMRSEEIRMRINAKIGADAIGKIQLNHQHIGFFEPKTNDAPKKTRPKPIPQALSGDINEIQNGEFRHALHDLIKSYYNRGL